MSTRPDYVHCIADVHADNVGKSWCGRDIRMEFHFMNIDHAAFNGRGEGRLVACPDCVAKIIAALGNGTDQP